MQNDRGRQKAGRGRDGMGPSASDVVSVIIPTYNRCKLLHRAVASVQAQTYPHVEILVADDGSSDGSEEMIASLNDPRVTFLRANTNQGGGMARWRGAEAATGNYIAYLDSDDYWLPHKLERQIASLHEQDNALAVLLNPPMVIRAGELFPVQQKALGPGEHIADYVYTGTGGALQTSCFFLHAPLGKQVRFDPELGVNQDTDFLLRVSAAGAKFIYLEDHLHVHDINPRGDRISGNRLLQEQSMAWFKRVSEEWSPRARRGFYMVDCAVRSARNGKRLKGLWYYLRGIDSHRSARELARYFFIILGGGDMPRVMRRWRRQNTRV